MLDALLRFILKPFRSQRRRCPCGFYWEVIPNNCRVYTPSSVFAKWKKDLSGGVVL